MIADLEPYPAMKDSGAPWLGEVPEHWDVRPVAGLGSLFKGNGGNKGDEVSAGIPCVRYGDLYTRHEYFITRSRACVSEERAGAYTPILYGDVLFAASGETMEDIGRSAVNLIDDDARCGGDVLVLRPEVPAVPRYLGYAADSPASRNQKACMGRGFTIVHIYGGQLKRLLLPLPPLPEQAAIVRFLDHADRRIRRYIRAKQKLIKLLEEQKEAILHRAVTRGLDPDVRLKPSGVELLRDVPAHWEVRLLHHILDPKIPLAYGILLPGPRLDSGVPYLGAGDVRPSRLRLDVLPRTTNEIAAAYPRTRMRAGELAYAIRGSFGKVEVIPEELDGVNLSRDAARLAPREGIDAFWLAFLLRSRFCQEQFKLKEIGATITGVNIRDLKRVVLSVPPPWEQAAIVRFLDREMGATDAVIGRAHGEISLLREYRTRLIADVVTGKLDVREAAARLPDEVDEPEPLDEVENLSDAEDETAGDLDDAPEEAEA